MNQVLEKIGQVGIVPVIVLKDAALAVPVCRALLEGGITVAEFTFRTDAAAEAISKVRAEIPEVTVGAGTVLSVAQAEAAVEAGAQFVVSPGFSSTIVRFCQDHSLAVTPGCSTATDMTAAVEHGLEVVKFFPAEAVGGLVALKALAAPFGMLKFVPTGGISASNAGVYLAHRQVLAIGGSWMVSADLIAAGDWKGISALSAEAVALVADVRGS